MRTILGGWVAGLICGAVATVQAAHVELRTTASGVEVTIDGQPFTTYLFDSGHKPILWPILGPTGKEMTRAWPMRKDNPDEKTDHVHQKSFWFDHGDVNGVDFWAETAKVQGRQVHTGVLRAEGGQVGRLVTTTDWLDPEGKFKARIEASAGARDPDYQVRQSKIAVGSGGLAGRGPMNSRQKLYYLPEPHTDFIYAVVAEELGFLGASLVLLGFLTILWRGLRLSWGVNDDFGRYVALGATTAVVFQALINMSVVLDLMPTKGIPLPMISQGGSSLLSTLSSLGLLLSVSEHSG